jgi:hypothetical protein
VIHTGLLISYWTQYAVQHGVLPAHNQGKFVKKKSFIHDENVQRILEGFFRSESQVSLTSTKMAQWISKNLHLKLGLESPVTISSRTSQRWLNILGLRFGKSMKGLYNDPHEREDVVSIVTPFWKECLTMRNA